MGGYPAFPALSETIEGELSAPHWLDAMLTYLAEKHYNRFLAIANSGLWVATHPYIYNHFYQEGKDALSPRPPGALRAAEGGWRFEYPYDPLSQASKPGLTTVSGPPDTPLGDPVGLIAMGDAFMQRFDLLFGGGAIPVVGTEGGIFPVPRGPGEFHQLDTRYPGYGYQDHAEATVAMFNWIAQSGPPWMFGVALWKENDYYDASPFVAPAVGLMSQYPALQKQVPPLEAIDGVNGRSAPRLGPGPIHGTPDLHFVLIMPGFNSDWFFSSGSTYWERFRPSILPDIGFISNIPYEKTCAVTLLATPETVERVKGQFKQRFPNVWLDVLAAQTQEELAQVLAFRASTGRKFG
jgi:hypothetical protein